MKTLLAGMLGVLLTWGAVQEAAPVRATPGVSESLACDDAGTLASSRSYAITVQGSTRSTGVKLVFGDLGGVCLPTTVLAAIGFVIAWAKGHPGPATLRIQGRVTAISDTQLTLPVQTFAMREQSKQEEAQVAVQAWTLKYPGGTYSGTGQLTLQRQGGGPWRVTAVANP